MRRKHMIPPGVYPGIAGAQSQDGLDHAWAEVLQSHKDQRQQAVGECTIIGPAITDMHERVRQSTQDDSQYDRACDFQVAWQEYAVDEDHDRQYCPKEIEHKGQ